MCARTYQMEGTYRRHFISHFDSRLYACEICHQVIKFSSLQGGIFCMMWMWGSVWGIYIVLYSWTKQVRIKVSQVSSYNAQDQNVTQFLALIARRPFVIYQKKKKK